MELFTLFLQCMMGCQDYIGTFSTKNAALEFMECHFQKTEIPQIYRICNLPKAKRSIDEFKSITYFICKTKLDDFFNEETTYHDFTKLDIEEEYNIYKESLNKN